jgi:arylsulfatase
VYFYNWLGHDTYKVEGTSPLPSGDVTLKLSFEYDGGGLGKGGTARLLVNDQPVGTGRIEKTVPFMFSMSGETFDVGEDTGAAVGPYQHRFPFTGTIRKVEIELHALPDAASTQAALDGRTRAALRSQ